MLSSHYVATSIWYELILNYLVLLTLLDPGFLSYCNPQGVGSGQTTQDLKYKTHTKNPPYNCFLPKSSQFLFLLILLMAWQFSCPICRQKVVKNCRQEGAEVSKLCKICRHLKWMVPSWSGPFFATRHDKPALAQADIQSLFWHKKNTL